MDDWKYLRKLQLTEKHGILKGIAIAVFVVLLIASVACAIKCFYMKKGCACCGDDVDDFDDFDDFEDDDFEDE